jgi:hypothetical protein
MGVFGVLGILGILAFSNFVSIFVFSLFWVLDVATENYLRNYKLTNSIRIANV